VNSKTLALIVVQEVQSPTATEWISATAQGVLAICALLGLWAWRTKMRGEISSRTAHRLLAGVYLVEQRIKEYRYPLIAGEEAAAALANAGVAIPSGLLETAQAGAEAVREARWGRLMGAWDSIQEQIADARAIWGESIQAPVTALRGMIVEIQQARREIRLLDQMDERSNEMWQRRVSYQRVLAGNWSENDSFAKRVTDAIASIERLLKPHVRLRPGIIGMIEEANDVVRRDHEL